MNKSLFSFFRLGVFLLCLATSATTQAESNITNKDSKMIKITTNHGTITLALNAEKAPKTVANFLSYVGDKYYDGLIFHRVIPGFMIQGGGFNADMKEKKTQSAIDNEADNGLANAKYSIAMARTDDPHSATGQFFINLTDNTFLNHSAKTPQGWGYAVFGQVSEGFEVVDAIAAVSTGRVSHFDDVPNEAVIIISVVAED